MLVNNKNKTDKQDLNYTLVGYSKVWSPAKQKEKERERASAHEIHTVAMCEPKGKREQP